MSLAPTRDRLQLPEALQGQLRDFRRRVWTIKTFESFCAACFGILVASLATFALDRVWDTPPGPRLALFLVAALGCSAIPLALYRWVYRRRRPDQLARLLARKHPRIGDQLLGVIELVEGEADRTHSRRLCEAAIEQVAADSAKRDFRDAVPNPRPRLWAWMVAVPAGVAVALACVFPDAASNAWARFLAPWRETPRYTFATIEPLPGKLVVAHGEPFSLTAKLTSQWKPLRAEARLGDRAPVEVLLRDGGYEFELPSLVTTTPLEVRVGDGTHRLVVEPMLRPELTAVAADVVLPEYLERPGTTHKDVRGGAITLVKGTRAHFSAQASRELAAAWVDGQARDVHGASLRSPLVAVEEPRTVAFRWRDAFGLEGKEAFSLKVTPRDDEAPTLAVEDLPRLKVVIDTEVLKFKARAGDDFGVKRVGIEWQGIDPTAAKTTATGERILAPGGPDKESMEVDGTFSARSYGIEPQPVTLRVFAEDYLPGRPRVYSPPYTLYILTAEQHAIWLTEQLSRWHRQSLEVRDRELQLFEVNKALRELPEGELDRPENRKRLEAQAQAERANGRRLSSLVTSGEDLVKQAMRNPEFGVGHLEKWAEMLQVLKDISSNRMPSVADLLKQAADSKKIAQGDSPANKAPGAGMVRDTTPGKPASTAPGAPKPPSNVPSLADRESNQQPPDTKKPKDSPPSPPKTPRFLLPNTTLGGAKPAAGDPPPPVEQKVDQALAAQRDLLAEFEKVADELNKILANLEGSTLVKRLKAASRTQYTVAGKIGDLLGKAFGISAPEDRVGPVAQAVGELAEVEFKGSRNVSVIMDDLQAYFERRRMAKFKSVLDEMREKDVIGALRQLGDDLKKEQGLSIAQAEFWSDTLDRWAEDLVDPASSGACPGSKAKGSLPPSIVLEVLQILEAEVNLRDETRVAQQARPALAAPDFGKQASALAKAQGELEERVVKVNERIKELPDAEEEFPKEIALLARVAEVMDEAEGILKSPETGPTAIAAETEAIELLLQSKRINPKGGGGGGSSPGGGGKGTTTDSALALIGNGLNQKEVREDRGTSQATGETGPVLPEEFRAGLDQYFNKLEQKNSGGQ